VGSSPALSDIVALATQIATSRSVTVLLIGETGTGKELFARGIHSMSVRASEPFVAINCAAIPDTLLESELFGHEAGAFTDARRMKQGLFELAGSGTVFLDEIADLPLSLQAKLLRVLEERKYRRLAGTAELTLGARIVAATNARLEKTVAEGQFREDLFYRLNVARVELPPLRERGGDVVLLAKHFVEHHAKEENRPGLRLAEESLEALQRHHWPGNVRELKNVIERAVLMCTGDIIEPRHVSLQRRSLVPLVGASGGTLINIPVEGKSLETIEQEAIRITLGLTSGNMSAAARILGISRPTLARKLREQGHGRRSILASS
jgi:transcriptional regulator with PAS, ATPase and Fis domain